MKHILILITSFLLLAATDITADAQNRIFGNIKKTEGLTMVYISPAAMKLGLGISGNILDKKEYANLGTAISNPRGMEILTTEEPAIAAMLREEVQAAVERLGMVLLLNASEDDSEDVDIYIGRQSAEGSTVSDILIVASEGNECSIVYIGGDISTDIILQQ